MTYSEYLRPEEPQGSDLEVVSPSSPDAVLVYGCSGEMCKTYELPPSELATLSGTTRTRGEVTCVFTCFTCVALCGEVLTLVVRMVKMRGEKFWCSRSPGSSRARQLYR